MDWKDVGKLIAPIAPVAGSILGGFLPIPGGSLIGQKFGEVIAGAFGVAPTPQAVSDAVSSASEETARAKIAAATDQARIQIDGFVNYERAVLEAQVKNLSDVNATIQADNDSRVRLLFAGIREGWFFSAWRPAFAWAFIAVWAAFGLMMTAVTARAAWAAPDPLTVLKDAWPLFAAYFVPGAAVLGVLIPSRSYEKGEAIKAGVPMPNAALAKPVPVLPVSQSAKSAVPPKGFIQAPAGSRP